MAHGYMISSAVGTLTGHAHPVLNFPEAADQTFIAGDFVYLVAGHATICGADPALIMGMALEPAHNTTAGLYTIGVALALEITLFGLCVYHATAASALLALADLGVTKDIHPQAAGTWTVDIAVDTTTSRFVPLKLIDPVGTQYGRFAGVICATYRQIGFVGA